MWARQIGADDTQALPERSSSVRYLPSASHGHDAVESGRAVSLRHRLFIVYALGISLASIATACCDSTWIFTLSASFAQESEFPKPSSSPAACAGELNCGELACPAGKTCVKSGLGMCTCVPIPGPCGDSAPLCNGFCRFPGKCKRNGSSCECVIDVPTPALTPCGKSFPSCNGYCGVGETCVNAGSYCKCRLEGESKP